VLLARAYLARRDIPAAGRTLEGAVARGLDVAVIYAELADVYEAFGRPENSIPAMRLAIARDPKSEAYRFRYAMLLTDTKAPAAAVIRLQEALQEFPRSSRLWFALGVAESAQNKTDEAARALTMRGNSTRSLLPLLLIWALLMLTVGNMTKPLRFTNKRFRSTIRWPSCITLSPMRCSSSTTDATRAEHLARAGD
jgi:Tfp pilus assembly protein PilF